MSEVYAPNQQNVRPDGSGPAEEGEGGSSRRQAAAPATEPKPEPKPEPHPPRKGR